MSACHGLSVTGVFLFNLRVTAKGAEMQKFLNWLWLVLRWLGTGLVILVIVVGFLLTINRILPPDAQITIDVLMAIAGAALSISFKFLPWLRVKFAKLASGNKALINLVSVAIMAVIIYAMVCSKVVLALPGIECTRLSMQTMALNIFWGLVANQTTYVATTKPADVIAAEATRE
jgi:hypothetical protein